MHIDCLSLVAFSNAANDKFVLDHISSWRKGRSQHHRPVIMAVQICDSTSRASVKQRRCKPSNKHTSRYDTNRRGWRIYHNQQARRSKDTYHRLRNERVYRWSPPTIPQRNYPNKSYCLPYHSSTWQANPLSIKHIQLTLRSQPCRLLKSETRWQHRCGRRKMDVRERA